MVPGRHVPFVLGRAYERLQSFLGLQKGNKVIVKNYLKLIHCLKKKGVSEIFICHNLETSCKMNNKKCYPLLLNWASGLKRRREAAQEKDDASFYGSNHDGTRLQ